jgi:hypothetical protein
VIAEDNQRPLSFTLDANTGRSEGRPN